MTKIYFFRKLQFFAAALVLFCAAMLPQSSKAINATEDSPVQFKVIGTMVSGDMNYIIDVLEVYNQTYQSWTITFPSALEIKPAGLTTLNGTWTISNQLSPDGTIKSYNFIIRTGSKTAAQLKTDLELLVFELVDSNVFPPDQSTVTITASATKVTFYQDEAGYVHYYEWVPFNVDGQHGNSAAETWWWISYNHARNATMQDPRFPADDSKKLQGYLATVTSEVEQIQIYSAIADWSGWLGGTRQRIGATAASPKIQDNPSINTTATGYSFGSDAAYTWYWACGPEAWTVYNTGTFGYSQGGPAYQYYPKDMFTVPSDGWSVYNENTKTYTYYGPSLSQPDIELPEGYSFVIDPNRGAAVGPLVFYNGHMFAQPTSGSKAVPGVYNNWNNPQDGIVHIFDSNKELCGTATPGSTTAEPNGTSSEYCLQFAYAPAGTSYTINGCTNTKPDTWNDYSATNTNILYGYFIEYGGYPGDPKIEELAGTGVTTSSEVDIVMPIIIQYRSTEKDASNNFRIISSIEKTKDHLQNYTLHEYYTAYRDDDPDYPGPGNILGYTAYGYEFIGDPVDKAKLKTDIDGNVMGVFSQRTQCIVFLYKPNQLTVNFYANFPGCTSADVSSTEKTVFYDSPYGVLPTATRKGWHFDGWFTSDLGGNLVDEDTIVTNSGTHTLFAHWTENTTYTVYYDENGATTGSISPKTSVSWTETGLLPTEPEKTDYVFVKWDVTVNGSKQGVLNTDSYGDLAFSDADSYITLQAQWMADSIHYVVIYQTNGSTSPTSYPTDTLTVLNVSDPVPMPKPDKTGYTFAGWYVENDGLGGSDPTLWNFEDGKLFTDLTAPTSGDHFIILGAVWIPKTFTVNYDINDLDTPPFWYSTSGVLWEQNGFVPAPGGLPFYHGYVFLGWNTKQDGTGLFAYTTTTYATLAGGNDVLSSVTLYAQWMEEPTYFVRYDLNGASSPSSIDDKTGVLLTDPNLLPDQLDPPVTVTPPIGYDAAGWSVIFNGTKQGVTNTDTFEELADNPNEGYIILQAQWSPKTGYTVSYDGNGGAWSPSPPIPDPYTPKTNVVWTQDNLTPPVEPIWANHTFVGWNTADNGSGVNANDVSTYGYLANNNDALTSITLYAQWAEDSKYIVIYDVNGGPTEIPNEELSSENDVVPNHTPVAPPGYTFSHWNVSDNGYGMTTGDGPDGFKTFKDLAYSGVKYIKLKANYTVKSNYTVYYDHNDGSSEVDEINNVKWTDANFVPHSVYRPGFTLSGWTTVANGSGITVLSSYAYSYLVGGVDDPYITLYAQWTPGNFIVQYDLNGGVPPVGDEDLYAPKPVGFDETDLVPPSFARDGYYLKQWNVSENGFKQNVQSTDRYRDLADVGKQYITLQIEWGEKEYEVLYDANGGSPSSIPSQSGIRWWTWVELPISNPSPPYGYDLFLGWKLSKIGTTGIDLSSQSYVVDKAKKYSDFALTDDGSTNITLQAQYQESADVTIYYETYNLNSEDLNPGGSVDPEDEEVPPATGTPDGSTATPAPGYHFVGWYLKGANYTNINDTLSNKEHYVPERNSNEIYEEAIYVAVFAENSNITINYTTHNLKRNSSDTNAGGSVSLASESIPPATGTAAGSTATPAAGYHFVGWFLYGTTYTDNDFRLSTATKYTPSVNEDDIYVAATYVAVFEENDSITIKYTVANLNIEDLNTCGSVSPTSETLLPATGTVTGSTATQAQGYHFVGWFLSGDDYETDTPIETDETFTPSQVSGAYEAAIYVAVFAVNTGYIVIYNTDGGTDMTDKTVSWLDDVLPEDNPTKTHFCLSGWEVTAGGDNDLLEIIGPYSYGEIATDDETMSITLKALWSAYELSTPLNDTLCVEGTAILTSTLTGGSEDETYKWQYSSNNIDFTNIEDDTPLGAIYTTVIEDSKNKLEITGLAVGNNYFYRLTVQMDDRECVDTSAAARVVVVPKPVLNVEVFNDTICKGGQTEIRSELFYGYGDATYQWEYLDGNEWGPVDDGKPAGAEYADDDTKTLQVSGIDNPGVYKYRLTVTMTGSACSTVSEMDSVVIIEPPVLSALTISNDTICQGGSTVLERTLSGGVGVATYQWQYNNGGTWASVANGTPDDVVYSGSTTDKLTISGISETGIYYYHLVAYKSGSGCEAIINTDSVVVIEPPTLTATVTNDTICTGGITTFESTLSGGAGIPTYQWQYNNGGTWANVANGTPAGALYANDDTETLQVSGIENSGVYKYRLTVEMAAGSACNAFSEMDSVVVIDKPILTDAVVSNDTICQGGTTKFESNLSGGVGTPAYQWEYFDGDGWDTVKYNIPTGAVYTDDDSEILQVTGIENSGVYKYRLTVTMTGSACDAISEMDSVVVIATPILTDAKVTNDTICQGGTTTFESELSGGVGTATYQWLYFDGDDWDTVKYNIPTGAVYTDDDTETLQVSGIKNPGVYKYRLTVEMTGSACNTVSEPDSVVVIATPVLSAPTVSTSPICVIVGETILKSNLTGGVGLPTYQWQYDPAGDGTGWIDIVDGTAAEAEYLNTDTPEVTISDVTTAGTYSYRLSVDMEGSACAAYSPAGIFTVDPTSVAGTMVADENRICYATGTKLTLNGYVGNIQWEISTDGENFTDIFGATSATYHTGNLIQNTWYKVTVTSGVCVSETSDPIKITVDPLAEFDNSSIVTSNIICESQNLYVLPNWNTLVTNGYGIWTKLNAQGTLSGRNYTTNGAEEATFIFSIYNDESTTCASSTPVATQIFTLTVQELPTLTVIAKSCNTNNVSTSPYKVTVETSGGSGNYTVSIYPTIGTLTNNLDNTWTVTNIPAGLGIDITVQDDLCSYTLPVTAPNCDCPVIPLPDINTNTTITECYDGVTTYTGSVDNPDETLYEIVWYTTQTGAVVTTAPSGSAVGVYTAWAALKNGDGCESATRVPSTVTILALPTATITTTSTTICEGSETAIPIAFTGVSPWKLTYKENDDENEILNITSNPYLLYVTPTTETTYTLISVDDANCSNTASGDVTISIKQKAEFDDSDINTSAQICASESQYELEDWLSRISNGSGEWSISGAAKGTLSGFIYTTNGAETVTFTYSVYNEETCASTTPTLTQNFTLTIYELPSLTITEIECDAQNSASDYHVTVEPNGGVSPYNVTANKGYTPNENLDGTWSITNISSGEDIIITIKDDLGCENSLTIYAPNCECLPVPKPDTQSVTNCLDGNTYTATAKNPDTELYEIVWYDAEYGGSIVSAPSRSTVGTISAWAALKDENDCESLREQASVTIYELPTATINGVSTTICKGNSADIEIELTGAQPWEVVYTDGTDEHTISDIPITPFTFSVNPEINTTYGLVSVMDGHSCNNVATGAITVSVNPVSVAGNISANDETVCYGTGTTISLSGNTGTIQWQSSTTSSTEGFINIPAGAINTISTGNLTQTTWFRAVVQNGVCDAATSDAVQVLVIAQPTLTTPTVSNSPLCEDGTTTLSSTLLGGTGTSTYQWQYFESGWNDITDGTPTDATYLVEDNVMEVSGIITPGNHQYRLYVSMTGSGCEVYSLPAVITVVPASNAGTISASATTICAFTETILTLTGYTGTIQWQSSTTSATTGFTNISGATAPTLSTGNLSQTTWYRVIVKNGVCEAETGAAIEITVDQAAGFDNAELDLQATICETENEFELPDWSDRTFNGNGVWSIVGAAKGILTETTYTTNGEETVTFLYSVSNQGACAYKPPITQNFTLIVETSPILTLLTKECNMFTEEDSPYSVTVKASGISGNYNVSAKLGVVTYGSDDVWTIANIPAHTDFEITITNESDVCTYVLPVTAPDCNCSVIPIPEINATTNITECYDGDTYTGSVGNPDAGLYDIVWYDAPSGGTEISAPSGSAVGIYKAWAALQDENGCESTRVLSTVTILALPTATISSSTSTICEGEDAEITLTLTGTQPWEVTYNDGTDHIISGINTTPHSFFVSPTGNTTYTLTAVEDALCSNTASGSIAITVDTKAEFDDSGITTSDQICVSETDYTLPDWSLNITNGDGEWTISGAAKGTLSGDTYYTDGAETVTFTYSIYSKNACASTTPTLTQNFTLTIPALPTLTVTEIECDAQVAGSDYHVTVEINGGVLPYNTITANVGNTPVNNGDGTWSISNIPSGEDIIITIEDDLGCENSLTIYAPNCECLPVPIPVTTSITRCFDGNTYTATAINPDPDVYEMVWYTTQTGSATTTAPSRNSVGTTTAWAALKDGAGCESLVRTQATVTILELPTANIISTSTTICNGNDTEIEIELTGVNPWNVVYTDGTNNYPISGISASPYLFMVDPAANTTYSLISVIDNQMCSNTATGAATISVNPVSVAGTITADAEIVCYGTGTNINLSDYVGSIQWQRSITSATLGFTDIPGGTSDLLNTGNLTQTTWFRAIVQSGVCDEKISAAVQVTVVPQPTLSIPTISDSPICEGGYTTLNSTLSGGTGTPTYIWQYLDTDWNAISAGTPTEAIYSVGNIGNTSTLDVAEILIAGNYLYRLNVSMTGSGCNVVISDPVTIAVVPPPFEGNIIADLSNVCYNTGTVLTLEDYFGTIQWQRSTTSATAGFTDIEDAISDVLNTGNLTQATWYRTVITNSVCKPVITTAKEIEVTPITALTLTSAAGTNVQTVRRYSDITTITYSAIPEVDYVTTGLPDGVTGSMTDGVITIAGAPTEIGIFNYTVTVTGYCGTEIKTGTITVKIECPSDVYDEVNEILYHVVEVAGMCWFKENVSGTQYQNDTDIPFAMAYYHALYPDVEQNKLIFGLLYNHESAFPEDPTQTLCPDGWRIPTSAEWKLLNKYNVEDLKNPTYWLIPNNATDFFNFDARGAGYYNGFASRYENLYGFAGWWASDTSPSGEIFSMGAVLQYYCNLIEIVNTKKTNALSVRCLMDD